MAKRQDFNYGIVLLNNLKRVNVNNTIKVSDEVIQELRIRKAKFGDKTIDETIRHSLGLGHIALNPKASSPESLNPIRINKDVR